MELLRRFIRDKTGQGLIEYAMMLGIVVIGTALVLDLLGENIVGVFTQIRITLADIPWD